MQDVPFGKGVLGRFKGLEDGCWRSVVRFALVNDLAVSLLCNYAEVALFRSAGNVVHNLRKLWGILVKKNHMFSMPCYGASCSAG